MDDPLFDAESGDPLLSADGTSLREVKPPLIIRIMGTRSAFEVKSLHGKVLLPRRLRDWRPDYDAEMAKYGVLCATRSRLTWLLPRRIIVVVAAVIAVAITMFLAHAFHSPYIYVALPIIAMAAVVIWIWYNASWWVDALYATKSSINTTTGVIRARSSGEHGGEDVTGTAHSAPWWSYLARLGVGTVSARVEGEPIEWTHMPRCLQLYDIVHEIDASGGNPVNRQVEALEPLVKMGFFAGSLTVADVDLAFGQGTAARWRRQRQADEANASAEAGTAPADPPSPEPDPATPPPDDDTPTMPSSSPWSS
jgi:hypothetical protein